MVIGEPQRAFYGNQFGLTFPVFTHYGVQLWVPEVGGAIDPGSEAHDLVMMLFGGMSKGERMRIKTRVRTAMSAQAATQGRFLGGRPPYGYRLADAGPHPNPEKAGDGKRLHRLEPDPTRAGRAADLRRVPRRSGLLRHRRAPHRRRDRVAVRPRPGPQPTPARRSPGGSRRSGRSCTNPRYTGYQVWAKQRREEVLLDVEDVAPATRP